MRTNRTLTFAATAKVHTFLRKSYAKYYTQDSAGWSDDDARLAGDSKVGDYTGGLGSAWALTDSTTGASLTSSTNHDARFQDDSLRDWDKLQTKAGTAITAGANTLTAKRDMFKYILGTGYEDVWKPIADLRAKLRPGSLEIVITTNVPKNNEADNLLAKVYGAGFLEKHRFAAARRVDTGDLVELQRVGALEMEDFRANPIQLKPTLDAWEWEAWDKVVRWRRILSNEDDYERNTTALNPRDTTE